MAFIVDFIPALLMGLIFGRSTLSAAIIGVVTHGVLVGVLAANGMGAIPRIDSNTLVVVVLLWLVIAGVAGVMGFALKRLISTIWTDPKSAGTAIGAFFAMTGIVAIQGGIAASYLFAIWTDVKRGNTGFFIADFVFPPFGVIRGMLLYFGWF